MTPVFAVLNQSHRPKKFRAGLTMSSDRHNLQPTVRAKISQSCLLVAPHIAYSFPSMTNLHCYKAGIALNNMAVSMVKLDRYHEAADTLKEALDLIRPDEGHVITMNLINEYIGTASKRLARPHKKRARRQAYEIRVLEGDQCRDAVDVAISDLPSSMRGNLLRIDDCASDEDDDEAIRDGFASVIILHNFATMCLWACWTGHNENDRAPSLRLFGFQFFTMAYTLLCEQAATTTDASDAARLTILTILVLQNMMHISFQLSEPMAGMKYYDKLCNQRSAYLELERYFPHETLTARIAASAA
jgi:hypothetical protein